VETLGRNGVSSNYRYDLVPYTWECVQGLRGGAALFTQPPAPLKCPGALQKIVYLAADPLRRHGLRAELGFLTAAPSIFGVPFYTRALDQVAAAYGVAVRLGHNLVAVDGPRRRATVATQ
jgi:sulfide:quinone oxidoreductase